jgi:hypothetical protein
MRLAEGLDLRVQLSHVAPVRTARFDEPSLVSAAGLVPAVALAQRAGLSELADRHLTVPCGAGSAASSVPSRGPRPANGVSPLAGCSASPLSGRAGSAQDWGCGAWSQKEHWCSAL